MGVLSLHFLFALPFCRKKEPSCGVNLGKIKSDQLEAYADARSEAADESRRWLAPVLESES